MGRYLFWDFDGTLAQRDGMWAQTILELLVEHGHMDIGREALSPLLQTGFPWHAPELPHAAFFAGKPWWEHMTAHFVALLMGLGLEEGDARSVADGIRSRYLDLKRWRLYEDTIPALQRAKALGFHSAILSNHVPELEKLADGLGIARYFDRIFSSALVGYEKPNPLFFRHAREELGGAQDAVMIGDSMAADVGDALAAGLGAILVRGENAAGYPRYAERLTDVFDLLEWPDEARA